MLKKEQQLIEKTLDEAVKQFQIDGTLTVTVADTDENADDENETVDVLLATEDTSLVIGYHGETLESLQLILSLIISQKLGRFVRVSLEVGDYKKNRSEYLRVLVERTKDRVVTEQQEVPLPDLKSWERRVVHMMLQDDPEVFTESVGEGKDRMLVVKQKK